MDDPQAAGLLEGLDEDERFATWHLARRGGSLLGFGAGVVPLLEAMQLTRPMGRAVARLPAGLVDRTYHVVARRRGRLGRVVPDRPGPRRFP